MHNTIQHVSSMAVGQIGRLTENRSQMRVYIALRFVKHWTVRLLKAWPRLSSGCLLKTHGKSYFTPTTPSLLWFCAHGGQTDVQTDRCTDRRTDRRRTLLSMMYNDEWDATRASVWSGGSVKIYVLECAKRMGKDLQVTSRTDCNARRSVMLLTLTRAVSASFWYVSIASY